MLNFRVILRQVILNQLCKVSIVPDGDAFFQRLPVFAGQHGSPVGEYLHRLRRAVFPQGDKSVLDSQKKSEKQGKIYWNSFSDKNPSSAGSISPKFILY